MLFIQRVIHQVARHRFDEVRALEDKYEAIEKRHGFPPKKLLRCMVGGRGSDTLIVEHEWESMAAMEAAYEKAMADPEWDALGGGEDPILLTTENELYSVLS